MNNPTRRTVLFFTVFLIFSMAFASAFDLGDWMKGLFRGGKTTGYPVESGGSGEGGGAASVILASYNFSDGFGGASYTGAMIVNEGIDGKAASFDGTDDYAKADLNMNGDNFTLSFWFNTRDAKSIKRIIEHQWYASPADSGIFTTHISNGKVYAGLTMDDKTQPFIATTISIDANRWYQYILTYDSSTAKVYLDGLLQSSLAINKPIKKTTKSLIIGGVPGVSFNGSIDEIIIYNRGLSADEVKRNYDGQKSRLVSASAGGGTSPWAKTFTLNDEELSKKSTFLPGGRAASGVLKDLRKNERILILVNGETYYVGVIDILDKVILNVSTKNQDKQIDLRLSESKDIDLNLDSSLDISIKSFGFSSTPTAEIYIGPILQQPAQLKDRCLELSDSLKTNMSRIKEIAKKNNYNFVMEEGANLSWADYVVIYSPSTGNKGRILQLAAIGDGTSHTDKTTFKDVYTGENFDFVTGVSNASTRNIDGYTFYVSSLSKFGSGKSVNITWGDGATYGNAGKEKDTFFCATPEPAQCTDSDNGKNEFVYGVTNSTRGSFNLINKDHCALVSGYDANGKPSGWQDAASCIGSDCFVEETYCDPAGLDGDADVLIKCPNGCKEGACVKEEPQTCTDSDNGWDYNVTGMTTGYETGTTNIITRKDYCADDGKIVKYFCIGSNVADTVSNCPSGYSCKEGACIGTTTVVSGEFVSLATSSQKLYMNSSLNSTKTVLDSGDLPTLLANGVAIDITGKSYTYTQKLIMGGAGKIGFSNSGQSQDPIPLISLGNLNPTIPHYSLFGYEFLLTRAIDPSDKINVAGTVEFKILGKKYVLIDGDRDNLYLFSGGKIDVDEGVNRPFVVEDGTSHSVSLIGTSSATSATIVIDGIRRDVTKGSTYKFGIVEVFIKDVYHATKTGTESNVVLIVSSDGLLHISNGLRSVKRGVDDASIAGTIGEIYWQNGLIGFRVYYGLKNSDEDHIPVGGEYEDGVFGNLRVKFVSLNPPLKDSSRNSIVVDTDNEIAAKVTLTTALSGKPATLYYARDSDGVADARLSEVRLADNNGYIIHVQEGENMSLYDKILVNAGDMGRILQLTAIGGGTSSSDKTTFQDVITGESFDFTTGVSNVSTRNIDGQAYHVSVTAREGTGRSANITWGTGAVPGFTGMQITLFPRIRLKDGGWFTILSKTKVYVGKPYSLPGINSLSEYENGITYRPNFDNVTLGKINYYSLSDYIYGLNFGPVYKDAFFTFPPSCNFNDTQGPAILFQEKKTVHGSANVNGEVICIPLIKEGTATIMPAVSSPVFSDETSLVSLQSSTTKLQGVTTFGTLVERDTVDNNKVTISYPSSQMTADVLIGGILPSPIQQPPGGGGGGGSCQNGCRFDDKCIPYGNRAKGQYCDIDGTMKLQLEGGLQCENNYECSSNFCLDGQCTEKGFFQRLIDLIKKILGIG